MAKRKAPTAAKIKAYLKKQGHATDKADKCTDKKAVYELHGVVKA